MDTLDIVAKIHLVYWHTIKVTRKHKINRPIPFGKRQFNVFCFL